MTQDKEVTIVLEGAEIRYVYDDDVADAISPIGRSEIRRASNVEPLVDGIWRADMSAVGARPMFGTRRSDLIKREVSWLESHGVPFPAVIR